jgi:hypothetical protein
MPFSIKRLYVEDDRAVDSKSTSGDGTKYSWPDIELSIRALDGDHRSVVIFGQDDPEVDFMGVGGGSDGVYRCIICTRDGREVVLIDPNQKSDELREVMVGQKTQVSATECHPLATVLKAAETYATTGAPDASLTWRFRSGALLQQS